jgi:DNA polymerase-3 subunit delta'
MLKTALGKRRLAHGYLFEGPDSVGKRLTALAFAKAVNCEELNDDSCDTCVSCLRTDEGNHPDVTVIEPVKAGRIIHVKAMSDLIEHAVLKPYRGKYRFAIIVAAERMNAPAANKFLKTLEEPPGNSMFVLVSDSPAQLPATITSRCQRVKFHPLTPHTIEAILVRERNLPPERARVISVLAQGQMGKAFELADSEKREFVTKLVAELTERRDPLLVAQAFLGRLKAERDRLKDSLKSDEQPSETDSEELAERREAYNASLFRKEVLTYLDLLRAWYRDMLVFAATGASDNLWNVDLAEMVAQQARHYAGSDIKAKLEAVERAQVLLESNVNEDRAFRELFCRLAESRTRSAHLR